MKTAEVLKEHAFLEKMVGDWTVAASDMTGDKPWQETVRSLQGIWFVAEGAGQMSDGKQATTILTLGYDSSKGKYVGSWIGSMMDYMIVSWSCQAIAHIRGFQPSTEKRVMLGGL